MASANNENGGHLNEGRSQSSNYEATETAIPSPSLNPQGTSIAASQTGMGSSSSSSSRNNINLTRRVSSSFNEGAISIEYTVNYPENSIINFISQNSSIRNSLVTQNRKIQFVIKCR
jgi:hypothetical protein